MPPEFPIIITVVNLNNDFAHYVIYLSVEVVEAHIWWHVRNSLGFVHLSICISVSWVAFCVLRSVSVASQLCLAHSRRRHYYIVVVCVCV